MTNHPKNIRHSNIIILVMVIFFTISFITNILNSIIVDVKESYDLSLGLTGFLPFSFFIAYGVMSIPAGYLSERFSDKMLLTNSFFLIIVSCLTFVAFPTYIVFTFTLFFLGCSMAILQVVINPMLRSAGGEENFAFNSVLAQLIFGLASFASPYLYIYLVNTDQSQSSVGAKLRDLVPLELPWVTLYIVFALIALIILFIVQLTKYPIRTRFYEDSTGNSQSYRILLKNKFTWLFFIGIFCYVGVEQGIGNWISEFLSQYHGISQIDGANIVAYFWAMITVGCLLGLVLLRLIDSRKILIGSALLTMITIKIAIFGSTSVALIAFPAMGFFISVMWSIIFSLGLNSVAHHHGSLSGILCTGIAGGAIMPLIVGMLGDLVNLKFGMLFLLIPLAFILSIGFWAKPLIVNSIINLNKE